MSELIFITGNAHKAAQVQRGLDWPVAHQKVDLDEIQSFDAHKIVEHKLRQAFALVGRPVLVEDVSLTFEAIAPLPGPFVKWFNEVGSAKMCRMLDGFDDRRASTLVTYGWFDGRTVRYFEAEMRGRIADAPRGNGGFGFDTIFINDGQTRTRAELDEATYAATSHRLEALAKLRVFLAES